MATKRKAQGIDAGKAQIAPYEPSSGSGRAIMRWREAQLARLQAAKEQAEAVQNEAEESGATALVRAVPITGKPKDASSKGMVTFGKATVRASIRMGERLKAAPAVEAILDGSERYRADADDEAERVKGLKVITLRVIIRERSPDDAVKATQSVHRYYAGPNAPTDVDAAINAGRTIQLA